MRAHAQACTMYVQAPRQGPARRRRPPPRAGRGKRYRSVWHQARARTHARARGIGHYTIKSSSCTLPCGFPFNRFVSAPLGDNLAPIRCLSAFPGVLFYNHVKYHKKTNEIVIVIVVL
eukprot:COSAG02_NODE_35_length_49339_cov_20.375102_31_plen_118_part_00